MNILICPHLQVIFSSEFPDMPLPSEGEEVFLETSLFFLDTLSEFLAPSVPRLLKKEPSLRELMLRA
jgi:hypothetical protein